MYNDLTAAEFERKCRKINNLSNKKQKHEEVDMLMVKTLDSLGYGAGLEIVKEILNETKE